MRTNALASGPSTWRDSASPPATPIAMQPRRLTTKVPNGKVGSGAYRWTSPLSPYRASAPRNPPEPTATALIRAALTWALPLAGAGVRQGGSGVSSGPDRAGSCVRRGGPRWDAWRSSPKTARTWGDLESAFPTADAAAAPLRFSRLESRSVVELSREAAPGWPWCSFASFVDLQHSALQLCAVEFGYRFLNNRRVTELDERESAWLAGRPVDGKKDFVHVADLSKECFEF